MSNLVQQSVFIDNGNVKRERENFQNYLFDAVDLRNSPNPISFYRSDFRGARIINCEFLKNNFSNADYIDCYVSKTKYDQCVFKVSEIYNSYFESTKFLKGLFSSTSFIHASFKNSEFSAVKFNSSNIQESKFENCEIKACTFFKTSIDDVEFLNTRFIDVDLSPMTAINLFFTGCKFENVIIDADYLGSYFFKGNFLDELRLKYRGKFIKLDINKGDLLNNLFKLLIEKQRYYEAVNIIIQKNLLENKAVSIFQVFQYALEKLCTTTSLLIRNYQISKLFKLLEYYFNSGYIKLNDYYRIVKYIDNLDYTGWDISDQLDVISLNSRLKNLLYLSPINVNMLGDEEMSSTMFLTITINEEDEAVFEKLLEISITNFAQIKHAKDVLYHIASKRKGSLIYDIVIYSSFGILLLNSFRKYLSESKKDKRIVGLRAELATTALTKMIDNMRNENSPEEIKKILEVAKLASSIDQDSFRGESSTQQLLSIIKGIQGQPTTLKD